MRFWLALAPLLLLSLMAASCGDKGVPPPPEITTSLQIISGNNQIPKAGAFLPDSLLVRVVTNRGEPVPGVSVTYEQITPIDGGYFVWNTTRTTDSNGFAKNKYYADHLVGLDSIKVKASQIDDSLVYFVVNVIPDVADSIFRLYREDNDQIAPGGQKLPRPIRVKVADKFGNPVPGQRVLYKTFYRCLVETDSSVNYPRLVDTAVTRTNENGVASSDWIMTVNSGVFPTLFAIGELDGSVLDTVLFVATAIPPAEINYYYGVRNVFQKHCFTCHSQPTPPGTDYTLDYFYRVADNGNLTPPDANAPLLNYLQPDNHIYVDSINWIEEDIVVNWVVAHDTAHGSSGFNNYNDHMKNIFDANCAVALCHAAGASVYDLSSHPGILGGGSDATPNAVAGDSASLLVQSLLPGGLMRGYLGVDSVMLADSLINWVVDDSLRQY